jgi:hypothetical protein
MFILYILFYHHSVEMQEYKYTKLQKKMYVIYQLFINTTQMHILWVIDCCLMLSQQYHDIHVRWCPVCTRATRLAQW